MKKYKLGETVSVFGTECDYLLKTFLPKSYFKMSLNNHFVRPKRSKNAPGALTKDFSAKI